MISEYIHKINRIPRNTGQTFIHFVTTQDFHSYSFQNCLFIFIKKNEKKDRRFPADYSGDQHVSDFTIKKCGMQ